MKAKQKTTWPIWLVVIMLVIIVVIAILMITRQPTPTTQPTEGEGTLSADQVDVIPDIELSDCLQQIKATNPEMSGSDTQDNCIAIEAVNKGDKALCNQIVSPEIKQACLAQF